MHVFRQAMAYQTAAPPRGSDLMALKATSISTRLTGVADLIGMDSRDIEKVFVCETWSATLSTGLFNLGAETARLHGTAGTPCGILEMIRLYDPADWPKVLQALENAAAAATSFSFATTIRPSPGLYRPVFCCGQSQTMDETGGVIEGTFAVARLCVTMDAGPPGLSN